MNKIIYIFDPLCGWCYGFSSVLQQLHQKYADTYHFDVLSGGMITGARIAPFITMEQYIRGAYRRVEDMAGVKFGVAYLNKLLPSSTIMMDSRPPSYALETMRSLKPQALVAFAHALQSAHYGQGADYNDDQTYRTLAEKFEVDADAFVNDLHKEETRYAAEQNFAWCANVGVQGYPTLVMETDRDLFLIAHGYRPLAELEKVMASIEAGHVKG